VRYLQRTSEGLASMAVRVVVILGGVGIYLGCGGSPPPSDGEAQLFRGAEEITQARILNLSKWTSDFWREYGRFPSTLAELSQLDVLNLPPPQADLSKDPRHDAWGQPIQLTVQQEGFELRSNGPDGAAETADDIVLEVEDPSEVH